MPIKNFQYGTDRLTLGSILALTSGRMHATLSAKIRHKIDRSATFAKEVIFQSETTNNTQNDRVRKRDAMNEDIPFPPLPLPIAKTMMIMKVQAFAQGYSGVELRTLERIIWMTQQDIIPAIPVPTLSDSPGDPTPLTHLFAPLVGRGNVYYKGTVVPTPTALGTYGMPPLRLHPTENLALHNGISFLAAQAVHLLSRLHNALEVADLAGAISLEGLMGSYKPFEARLYEIRTHPGNQLVAHRLWELLHTSEIANSNPNTRPAENPKALRSMPQIHGASRTAWLYLKELTEIEINVINSGNVQSQPLTMAIHYAAATAMELRKISGRRIQLITLRQSPLPEGTGHKKNAAGVNELNQVIDELEQTLATELVVATQALEARRPLRSSDVLEACYALVKEAMLPTGTDAPPTPGDTIQKIRQLISSGRLLKESKRTAKASGYHLNKDIFEAFEI